MAGRKRRIALLVAGLVIAAGVGIGVVVVGIPMLGAYLYIHAHDHRELAESAPTLVGIRADDGRLTVHVNLCGETLEAVRVVSWEEDTPEPLPIWRASMPRGGDRLPAR